MAVHVQILPISLTVLLKFDNIGIAALRRYLLDRYNFYVTRI